MTKKGNIFNINRKLQTKKNIIDYHSLLYTIGEISKCGKFLPLLKAAKDHVNPNNDTCY